MAFGVWIRTVGHFDQIRKKTQFAFRRVAYHGRCRMYIFFSSFVCRALRIKAYYIFAWGMDFPYTHFYKPLIYAPMTELSATGTLSWKLLILPTLCLAGFWGLLRFAKTKKQHSLREVEKCNGK